MDILVSLNENYLPQLRVLLTSLFLNNPGVTCTIYLLHRNFDPSVLQPLQQALARLGHRMVPIQVDEQLFQGAPVMKQYPQEMYFRLLAGQLLPDTLDRVLYLDPDILVINPLAGLWNLEMGDSLFAAASHQGAAELAGSVNRLRLGTDANYYNSGVLLINLAQCRARIAPDAIFGYVREHAVELVLPDQDVLNALYGDQILEIRDDLWNYDARNYASYYMLSHGEADLAWVMAHTSILHFCGREKPWLPHYRHRFGVLYLHYTHLADKILPLSATP